MIERRNSISGAIFLAKTQLFFQILLSEKTSGCLTIFNCHGKARVTKNIWLPADISEYHQANQFLVCYSGESNQIFVVEITNMNNQIKSCMFIEAREDNEKTNALRNVYYDSKLQLILFSDCFGNVCYLQLNQHEIKLKQILKLNHPIDKLQTTVQGEIVVLHREEQLMRTFQVDWNHDQIEQQIETQGVWDFHFKDNWDAILTKMHPVEGKINKDKAQENEIHFDLKKGTYERNYNFSHPIIMQSSSAYFLLIDPQGGELFAVFNGLEGSRNEKTSLWKEVKEGNLLIGLKSVDNETVDLHLSAFDDVQSQFHHWDFAMREISGKESIIFIKNKIEHLFNTNGLINPFFEGKVKVCLRQLLNDFSSLSRSKNHYSDFSKVLESSGKEKLPQLGRYLLEAIFEQLPNQSIKLAKFLVSCREERILSKELSRFLHFCQDILLRIIQVVKQEFLQNPLEEAKDELQVFERTLSNMNRFLFLLVNEVQQQTFQHQLDHDLLQKDSIKEHAEFQRVYQQCKSVHLILMMLLKKDVNEKIQQRFKTINREREHYLQIFKQNPVLVKLELLPLLFYEHFQKVVVLTEKEPQPEKVFKFLLQNSDNFYETAYFYQSILREHSTPYLKQDVYDLFESIDYKGAVMASLDQELNSEKKQEMAKHLPKMIRTALNAKMTSALKYLAQISLFYGEAKLILIIFHSEAYKMSEADQVFMIKILIASGKLENAFFLVKQSSSEKLLGNFVETALKNSNLKELMGLMKKELLSKEEKEFFEAQIAKVIGEEKFAMMKELLS